MTLEQLKNLQVYYTNEGCGNEEYVDVIEIEEDKYLIIGENLNKCSKSQLFRISEDLSKGEFGLKPCGTFQETELYKNISPILKMLK